MKAESVRGLKGQESINERLSCGGQNGKVASRKVAGLKEPKNLLSRATRRGSACPTSVRADGCLPLSFSETLEL
jgi:hypothetical protein